MARDKSGPQLVGSSRAAAGEVEIPDDDALASRMIAATEDEIWRDATMLQDDDDSGDKTLEAMEDGFDGETEGEPSRRPTFTSLLRSSGKSPCARIGTGLVLPDLRSYSEIPPNCSYTMASGPSDADFTSSPWFGTAFLTALLFVS